LPLEEEGALSAIPQTFFRATVAGTAADCRPLMQREDKMPTFICSLGWTEQGIKSVKDAPQRAKASKALAKKMGVNIKQVFMTTGNDDLLVIVEADKGDSVAKFAMALSAQGNVRTRTVRAWSEAEMEKLISELP